MLNYLWAGMIVVGILWGTFHGNIDAVTNGMLESAKEAVTLCIAMLGVMSFWCGILKIGERAGLIEAMTRKMKPIIRFLFPDMPIEHPAAEHISTNMIANVLGLGWAATPAGLRAMKELCNLEESRNMADEGKKFVHETNKGMTNRKRLAAPKGTASKEMCTFLIINISSLQLIPMNMIAYRSQYGSINPTAIVGPAIIATTISTMAGILFCKVMQKIS